MDTIVVGVDGSECARAALEFAAREAAMRKARLRIGLRLGDTTGRLRRRLLSYT
jgi:nucleotide-binding universal stress UspA family protein